MVAKAVKMKERVTRQATIDPITRVFALHGEMVHQHRNPLTAPPPA